MPRGEKTLTFDFPIRFSENGEWSETDKITICAPGLGKYDVYTTMQSYVGKALLTWSRGEKAKQDAQTTSTLDDDDEKPEASDENKDVMLYMSMGLDTETYPKFASYVQRVLTNSPKLARVGDNKAPLTDDVWASIEEQGGMEAVTRIMSEFVDFFFEALESKKKRGAGKSRSSSSPTKADSPSSGAKTSRSKN